MSEDFCGQTRPTAFDEAASPASTCVGTRAHVATNVNSATTRVLRLGAGEGTDSCMDDAVGGARLTA